VLVKRQQRLLRLADQIAEQRMVLWPRKKLAED
jgi:hypothetical protein